MRGGVKMMLYTKRQECGGRVVAHIFVVGEGGEGGISI